MSTIKISGLATGAINTTDLFAKSDPAGFMTKNTIQALITLIESGVFTISNNLSEGNPATIRANIDAAGLSVVNTFTGLNTFTEDITVGNVKIGIGYSSQFTNLFVGANSQSSMSSGGNNISFGNGNLNATAYGSENMIFGSSCLNSFTNGNGNLTFGYLVLFYLSSGFDNLSFGNDSGKFFGVGSNELTSASGCLFIGNGTRPLLNNAGNEIVIGDSTIGNGSNTVTLGNTNITDSYLNGNVHSDAFIKSGGTSTQSLMADGSVSESSNLSIEQVGEDVAIGDILYLKADGKFWKASNTSYALVSGSLRISTEVILTDASGLVASNNTKAVIPTTAISIGAIAYMGATGSIISEADRDLLPTGSFSRRVGVVYNATTLYFNPIGYTYEI
jgi:hypothetical protein